MQVLSLATMARLSVDNVGNNKESEELALARRAARYFFAGTNLTI
jgi:hypothetical protein